MVLVGFAHSPALGALEHRNLILTTCLTLRCASQLALVDHVGWRWCCWQRAQCSSHLQIPYLLAPNTSAKGKNSCLSCLLRHETLVYTIGKQILIAVPGCLFWCDHVASPVHRTPWKCSIPVNYALKSKCAVQHCHQSWKQGHRLHQSGRVGFCCTEVPGKTIIRYTSEIPGDGKSSRGQEMEFVATGGVDAVSSQPGISLVVGTSQSIKLGCALVPVAERGVLPAGHWSWVAAMMARKAWCSYCCSK